MRRAVVFLLLAPAAAVSGCAVAVPTAPGVMVMPPPNKPLASFQSEDAYCRRAAYDRAGASQGAQSAAQNATTTAVLGTATGAAAGALIGSVGAHLGAGGLVGAAYGLVVGGAMAVRQAEASSRRLQYGFDTVYVQCMYSYGNSAPTPPLPVAHYAPTPWYSAN